MTTDTSRIDTSPAHLELLADQLWNGRPEHNNDKVAAAIALRALAAEKRAAGDGITDKIVFGAMDSYLKKLGLGMADMHFDAMKTALQSAALALQSKDAQRLPPIEHDKEYDRYYIPLPGGWEVQTKGKGSTFRLCNTKTGRRMAMTGHHFETDEIEQMARDIHAAMEAAHD